MKLTESSIRWIILGAVVSFGLSVCTAATPAHTPTAVSNTPNVSNISTSTPLLVPSLSDGENSYAAYCANCHPQTGSSDLESPPVIKLISNSWIRQTNPADMYAFLATGTPVQGMPSFAALNSSTRWNLVAYLLSLVSNPQNQTSSQLVYQNMCQSCHGEAGEGNGSQAIKDNLVLNNWQSEPLLVGYSNDALYNAIRMGSDGHNMGTYAHMLNDPQIWSLVSEVRSLSLGSSNNSVSNLLSQLPSAQNSLDVNASNTQTYFTIIGNVQNGSGETDISKIGDVKLVISSGEQVIKNQSAKLSSNGSFRFPLVPYNSEWSYFTQVTYSGVPYSSARISGQSFNPTYTIDLDITVFDNLSNTAVLRGEQFHALVVIGQNGKAHVSESLLISNPSSFTVVPINQNTPLLQFMLPANAESLALGNFGDSQNLKINQNTLSAWQPILPGTVHQIMFTYDLPFSDEQEIDFFTPVQLQSAVVIIQDQTNNISCTGMEPSDSSSAAPSLSVFTATNIEAGDKITLHCYNKEEVIPIALGIIFVVIVLILTVVFVRRTRQQGIKSITKMPQGASKNTLLDAIITLDDQLKSGQISAEAYQEKREELIRKLEGN